MASSGKANAMSMIEELDTISIPRNLINGSFGSAFVNMSASLSHVGTLSTHVDTLSTHVGTLSTHVGTLFEHGLVIRTVTNKTKLMEKERKLDV